MDSDEDLFYDSLDDEYFSPTIIYDRNSVPSEDDYVPLYDGEISRNDLSTKDTKKKSKKCPSRIPLFKGSSRSDYFVLEKDNFASRSNNSYLSLFRSRMNKKSDRIPGQETDRATDGDVTERLSLFSEITESSEHCCEFKDCVNDQKYDDCIYSKSARVNEVSQMSLDNGVSEMSNLKSVSQQNLTSINGGTKTGKKLYGKPKTQILSPFLGSLGPNIDQKKIELLQRKQNYGYKVSEKNRIKFIEKQVLQNLKMEIENCRENRKKELNEHKVSKTPSNPPPTSMSSSSSVLL